MDKPARSRSVIWATGAYIIGMFVLSYLIASLCSWVSGRPVAWGIVMSPIGITFPLVFVVRSNRKRQVVHDAVPEPANTLIREALAAVGLRWVKLSYGATLDPAAFPRPMAMGSLLMLSKRVLSDYSQEALMWSARTDAVAAVRFFCISLPLFFVLMLAALVGVNLCERWHAPNSWYAVSFSLVALAFVLLGISGYAFQLQADKRFTKTDRDRLAAKEALSYPFFAQADRKPSQKWMFSRLELRGRAKHLKIKLERGFKVPPPPDAEGV